MQNKLQAPAPDITVTTATQTEAQVRENLGVPAETAKPVEEVKPEAVVKADEAEADSPKPDAEISEAARRLRGNRSDVRKQKIQSEIDALVATREKTRAEVERLDRLRDERARGEQPPPSVAKPADAKPVADPAAPKFEFQSYEKWLEQNTDGDYEAYRDEKTVAHYAFLRKTEREAEDRDRAATEQRRVVAENVAHVEKFKAEHPDYEDKLRAVAIPTRPDGSPFPSAVDLNALIQRTGAEGPAILYHLATHPDKVAALIASRDFAELSQSFGELRFVVKAERSPSPPANAAAAAPGQATPAPAPAALKPVTDAPAPLTAVPGSAQTTRSLHQLAEDGDDADAYIAARKKQQKAG